MKGCGSVSKIVLKIQSETVTLLKVQYYDLDEFIEKMSGHPYNCVSAEEWSNDSHHRFNIGPDADQWDVERWESQKAGREPSFSLRSILTCLCAEGHIEPGIYFIEVGW